MKKLFAFLTGPSSEPVAWYIRLIAGGAAWLAATLFLIFLFGAKIIQIESTGSLLFLGITGVIAGLLIRFFSAHVIAEQVALPASLIGQFLLFAGIFNAMDRPSEWRAFFGLCAFVELILVFVNVDRVHRFLASVSCFTFFLLSLGARGQFEGGPIGVSWFVLGVLVLVTIGTEVIPDYASHFLKPVAYAAFVSIPAFGLAYWIKSHSEPEYAVRIGLMLVAYLLLLGFLVARLRSRPVQFAIAASVSFIFGWVTFSAPGILLSGFLICIAFYSGLRVLLGFGILVLGLSLWQFYYDLPVTLLYKSIALMVSGIIFLACWFGLKKWEAVSE